MLRAIAIDDEPLSLEIITMYCSWLDSVRLEKTFTRISDAALYLETNGVDVAFLDINMPMMSGIEFQKLILKETKVIYCTAHSEHKMECLNLSAVAFLLKPYSFEQFRSAVAKVVF